MTLTIPAGKHVTMAYGENQLHLATKPPRGVPTVADCGTETAVYICGDWKRNPIREERGCAQCFKQ